MVRLHLTYREDRFQDAESAGATAVLLIAGSTITPLYVLI
jgi:hypothetical protein